MIKSILASSNLTALVYVEDTADGDGTQSSPFNWLNHLGDGVSGPENSVITAIETVGQHVWWKVYLEAATSYFFSCSTGLPIHVKVYNKDTMDVITDKQWDASMSFSFDIVSAGFYLIEMFVDILEDVTGTNYSTLDPLPIESPSSGGSFVRHPELVNGSGWNKFGKLYKYRSLDEAGIKFVKIPDIPLGGLWGYYPLIDNFNDCSGNNHNLEAIGNLTINKETGVSGFGDSSYMRVSDFVSGTNPRSICMWFKFLGEETRETCLFVQGTENSGKNFGLTRYDYNKLRAHTYGWSDTYTLEPGELLHHVAITYSQETSTRRLMYVDGSLVKEWSSSTNTSTTPLYFGIWANGTVITNNLGFNGYLHDIALYNREISADEVMQIYNAGNSLHK